MSIMLTLPFPPSANRMWTVAYRRSTQGPPKRGMRHTDEYAAWLKTAGWKAKAQKPKPVTGPYKLAIHIARTDAPRVDLDNFIKPLNDLLQALALVENDRLCEQVSARWVTSGIGVTVLVEPAATELEAPLTDNEFGLEVLG